MPSTISNNDLSFSIVWSPLPPITWILPFIGHMGIADSHGVVSDFRGSFYVGSDGDMAFGKPTRYLKVDVSDLPGGIERWDAAIQESNQVYNQRVHNICCDNCHSHAALALNKMDLRAHGISKWDMVKLCFLLFFKGRFISVGGFLAQFLPFVILVLIISLTTSIF